MSGPSEPSALIGIGVLRSARGDLLWEEASYRVTVRDGGSAGALQAVEGTTRRFPGASR